MTRLLFFMSLACLLFRPVAAETPPLVANLSRPVQLSTTEMHPGCSRSPSGATISADACSLLLNGRPWTPVMGEFHYSRVPVAEWRESLLKAKAGGIDVVATYVFWIHHEEVEGVWDWSGERDLRRFVQTAAELGLKVVVRGGPWCHGEVRNGGLPDWLLRLQLKPRSDDPAYLSRVAGLYAQIALQLKGLLWKDGGPVIALQLENEYGGPGEHLLNLKRLAREAGLEVPLYTRTGWPELGSVLPHGEILPLYGAYAEGFWDRKLTSMPGKYWAGFHFSPLRIDTNIANEALGRREAKDAPDSANYPFLTCELGGGMMSSYHRRIVVDPRDIESIALVKLGSGSNLLGYYMYKGGFNPEGRLSTLSEAQDTLNTNHNDLPLKNYDFQAPLGEHGQLAPHYHRLRRLHLFLREFGAGLASMPLTLPEQRPGGKDDVTTLRWSVRSDGHSGYVFINNHERGRQLPAKEAVRFELRVGEEKLAFPETPVRIESGASCFWPFNLELGRGLRLSWATAQPICTVQEPGSLTVFFAAPPDGQVQLRVDGEAAPRRVPAGRQASVVLRDKEGTAVRLVFLSEQDSLRLWKGSWKGRERALLWDAGVLFDGDRLVLEPDTKAANKLLLYPCASDEGAGPEDGVFSTLPAKASPPFSIACRVRFLRAAGAPRVVTLGAAKVAEQPSDAAFADAAEYLIELPERLPEGGFPILRLNYRGDVARLYADDRLVADDFSNGQAWQVGLRPPLWRPGQALHLKVLPWSTAAVLGPTSLILVPEALKTDLAANPSDLLSAELNVSVPTELR